MAKTNDLSSFVKDFAVSGTSIGIATVCTNPIDVVKVRLQLQQLRLPNGLKPDGMLTTGVNIVRHEGLRVLWSGWQASIARSFLYGGARLGMYSPIKTLIGADEHPSFAKNLLAGSCSGALAAVICNPAELLKVRLQSKENMRRGPITIIREVVAADGMRGLWRGTVPAATRASFLTASQLASYNDVKAKTAELTGWDSRNPALHFTSSMIAGLVSTTATNPVDVVKTKMFVSGSRYTGPIHCLTDLVKTEGLRGLLKGWLPNYCRLGPQTTIMFLSVEYLRSAVGLKTL